MSTLADSVVFDWLFTTSMVAVASTIIAWLICLTCGRRSAVIRHQVWLFALLAIVIVPLLRVTVPKIDVPLLPGQLQVDTITNPSTLRPKAVDVSTASDIKENNRSSVSSAQTDSTMSWFVWFVIFWGTGSALMLFRLVRSGVCLRNICRRATEQRLTLLPIARRTPKVLVSDDIDTPMVCGVISPVILLPKTILNIASTDTLKMVVKHELAHIERGDQCVVMSQRLVESVLFFHPFVWIISRQLSREREHICDLHAVQDGSPVLYAKLLSTLLQARSEPRPFIVPALIERGHLKRISLLLSKKKCTRIVFPRSIRVIMAAGVLFSFFTCGVVRMAPKAKPLWALPDEIPKRPRGTASISGKVVSAETGRPVEQGVIYMYHLETAIPIFEQLDNSGSFSIRDIAPGAYRLKVMRSPGFQDKVYDPEGFLPQNRLPLFELKRGEKRNNVRLALVRSGSIRGRIVGKNPERLLVHAFVKMPPPEQVRRIGMSVPNADGTFQIDGLDSEPTYLMVLDPRETPEKRLYCPQYYPGTFSPENAVPIDVRSGRVADNIVIQLTEDTGAVLEGIVTNPRNEPVQGAHVVSHPVSDVFNLNETYTDDQGRYTLQCLANGEYLVHVDATQHNWVRTRRTVRIGGSSESNRQVFSLNQGVTISIRFEDERGEPWKAKRSFGSAAVDDLLSSHASIRTNGIVNKHRPKSALQNVGQFFAMGEGDYAESEMLFTTPTHAIIQGAAPGNTTFRLHPKEIGLGLTQVLHNGKNVLDTGVRTRSGQRIEDLVFIIGKKEQNFMSQYRKEMGEHSVLSP